MAFDVSETQRKKKKKSCQTHNSGSLAPLPFSIVVCFLGPFGWLSLLYFLPPFLSSFPPFSLLFCSARPSPARISVLLSPQWLTTGRIPTWPTRRPCPPRRHSHSTLPRLRPLPSSNDAPHATCLLARSMRRLFRAKQVIGPTDRRRKNYQWVWVVLTGLGVFVLCRHRSALLRFDRFHPRPFTCSQTGGREPFA